ncbi:hypothetical protein BOX15_Mlig025799g1 [Macrostomum lignano]|uniref:Uncharacterized protein n=1 Tax=Macrostomum lignano TaxID=282301 RepID=A0A267FD46_9PLAT|nr:hypothetical protein BOX15_Mlig025799g1 [Macrostomum lignano]
MAAVAAAATAAADSSDESPSNYSSNIVKQLPYNRLPDGTVLTLDKKRASLGDEDTALVAAVFAVLLVVLILIYFALFLYQRIRYPLNTPQEELEYGGMETRYKPPESVNQVITKDELLGKSSLMDATNEKTETGQIYQKAELDRAEPKREVPSDAPSDASEETSESVRARPEFSTREDVNEVEDVPEIFRKISMPSSDRGRVRLSTDAPRAAFDDPNSKGLHRPRRQDDKKRTQYLTEYAEAYRLSIRREGRVTGQQKMAPLTDYNKYFWK